MENKNVICFSEEQMSGVMSSSKNHFYRMIHHLFDSNEVVLFGRVDLVSLEHEKPVIELIRKIYYAEALDYPDEAPSFDEKAASWSSKILFYSAQLLMYREHDARVLTDIISPFEYEITDSSILTADLSLRFLPALVRNLEQINVEDQLLPLLKSILNRWHYTGLLSDIELVDITFSEAFENGCLLQMYADRVIKHKKLKVAQLDELAPLVQSALGDHEQVFWKEFNLDI